MKTLALDLKIPIMALISIIT
ncbi:hypothetical protein NW739_01585 [Mycoplasmopsis felis]|nr:hypothetical protein [Mycoplasmopsis felis]MCU9939497.1 hypothetical protein [Mycoplasmopsis felis]